MTLPASSPFCCSTLFRKRVSSLRNSTDSLNRAWEGGREGGEGGRGAVGREGNVVEVRGRRRGGLELARHVLPNRGGGSDACARLSV